MRGETSAAASEAGRSRIQAWELRLAKAKKLNLLSDAFMSVALRDKRACQYVLRILTGIKDLVVLEVRTQYRVSKLVSHDAVLDVLAEDSKGRMYNIEIQRSNTIDHARRVRLYVSMVDSEYLEKGKSYADLPELYVIYISEDDLWKAGFTTYPVEKYFANTDIPYDDGQHILYVNAAVDDGSEQARLMQYFKTADPNDMSHGALSERVHLLKCEKEGESEMCEFSEEIFNEGRKEGVEEGIEKGIEKGEVKKAKNMAMRLAQMGVAVEKIAEAAEVSVGTVKQWLSGETPTYSNG